MHILESLIDHYASSCSLYLKLVALFYLSSCNNLDAAHSLQMSNSLKIFPFNSGYLWHLFHTKNFKLIPIFGPQPLKLLECLNHIITLLVLINRFPAKMPQVVRDQPAQLLLNHALILGVETHWQVIIIILSLRQLTVRCIWSREKAWSRVLFEIGLSYCVKGLTKICRSFFRYYKSLWLV